ncbi:SusC/RagA family TonB-linked outer membrane protein [Halalkalibaculum sp. DA3122]|uniref:SusC/RagA family TonB-linked outer membrane protein n=1 Tax=Halalkalibaculum sp. DA3122 TaxID=3373607 RepID=UPI0037548604
MKYDTTFFSVRTALLVVGLCLIGTMGYAQTLGSLYNSDSQNGKIGIEKGTDLEQALNMLEHRFNVVFLYRTDALEGRKVKKSKFLPNNVQEALDHLLEGQRLESKYLNPKTYGIFQKNEPSPNPESVILEQVSGTVFDANNGETLPGVNVVVQGTTTGSSTDGQGNYQLSVPSLQDTLVFSFVGYETETVPISGRTQIDVSMQPQTVAGEELVVVGYGTVEEQEITGSVSSVDSDEFVTGNVNNVGELIQGKVPGLTIAGDGANPNSSPTIRLRGISTFGENQSPLIVIDGIIGGSLENVDPNDIESIDVLKDASASAIYGTRGASGVIEVTTKKGVSGNLAISYNGDISFVGIESKLDVLTAEEFRNFAEDAGFTINDEGYNTNWYDEITQRGYNTTHSLAVSGGNESTTYRVSGNFRNSRGIQKQTGFQQINGRLNITQSAFDDKLDVTFDMAVTDREEARGSDAAFRYGAIYNPTYPVKAESFEATGGFFETTSFDMYNPVALIETTDNNADINYFNGAGRANYEFEDLVPGLSTSVFYSIETSTVTSNYFAARTSRYAGGATPQNLGQGNAEKAVDNRQSELVEVTANYLNEDLGKIRFESVAGYSYSEEVIDGVSAEGGDFVSDAVKYNNLSFAQDFTKGLGEVSSYQNTSRIIGFFGRINMNWDDTYFVNASLRREASTRFGEEQKWGTFGSVGGSVELTSLFDLPFMNQLKIRTSYGITGQNAPEIGISQRRYGPSGFFFVNGEFVQQFGPISNSNPELKWEETREYNFGVDFELLNSRVDATAEYYIRDTEDLLFNVQVPVPPNLFPRGWRNVGSLKNKGFEANVEVDVLQSQAAQWNTGLNFSTFNSVLEEYVTDQEIFTANAGAPGQNDTDMVRVKEGETIGQIWGPEFAGISSDGEWLFFNNAGEEVTFDQIDRDDEKILGQGLPDFSLGWSNSFSYKNWSLSAFIRGVFGHDMVNTYRLFYEAPSQITTYNIVSTGKDIPNLKSPPKYSSYHVENADFVRLQNLAIGYNIPLGENTQIRSLRLSLTGNNLVTITGYNGVDPDVNFIDPVDGGALAPGIERRNSWFTSRSITFGIDIQF